MLTISFSYDYNVFYGAFTSKLFIYFVILASIERERSVFSNCRLGVEVNIAKRKSM